MSKPASLARIHRLSAIMSVSCLLALLALPLALLSFWALADVPTLAKHGDLATTAIIGPVEGWQRLAGAGLSLLACTPLLIALVHTRSCFKLFAAGEYFASAVIHHLRGFAAWIFVATFAELLLRPTLSVVLTINNPPGSRLLSIGLSSHDFSGAFVAGMVWLIAAVMGHAQKIAEENAQFI